MVSLAKAGSLVELLMVHPGALGAAAICVALIIDRVLGEPPTRLHPVVWMGAYLQWAGRFAAPEGQERLSKSSPSAYDSPHRFVVFLRGALLWLVGGVLVTGVAVGLAKLLSMAPAFVGVFGLGLFLKPLLAWRMLKDEVWAVELALNESLDAGRAQLARLVSRDVANLDAREVRESAIETLAENLNDSVVAPLVWFLVAGLPGAALYRFANTADAMWGYRGYRNNRDWTWAGKWAARADDVLSWIPARVTALLIAALGATSRLKQLPSQARRTPSPNSGWPMAAMALALNVTLAKPNVYVLHSEGDDAGAEHIAGATDLASRVISVLGLLAGSATLFEILQRTL